MGKAAKVNTPRVVVTPHSDKHESITMGDDDHVSNMLKKFPADKYTVHFKKHAPDEAQLHKTVMKGLKDKTLNYANE
jgi:hypothetical protein